MAASDDGIYYEHVVITDSDDEKLIVVGYRLDNVKFAFSCIFSVLSVGVLQLVFMWRPDWRVKCTKSRCHMRDADTVVVTDRYMQYFVHRIHTEMITQYSTSQLTNGNAYDRMASYQADLVVMRYFRLKKIRYRWIAEQNTFEKVEWIQESKTNANHPCSYYIDSKGLTAAEQLHRRSFYGDNAIVVHVTSIMMLLLTQGLNPFYVFQVFSICLWIGEEYYYYAGCIGFISIVSLCTQIYQQRQTERELKHTIASNGQCSVWRADTRNYEEVWAHTLVPGDIIRIPKQGCPMYCDALLSSGNCIVNESMLTGESVPVTKTPLLRSLQDPPFDMKEHSRHVLFCGTNVIQTKSASNEVVNALVLRTGFNTSKGELVRSIMYPKPVDFKFTRDSYIYIALLFLFALGGMIYTIYLKTTKGDEPKDIVIRTLDLITIVVPPALPAAMTCGIVFAQRRLKKQRIFCISPRAINICGGINLFCFDKTGTLTEDGMDVNCLIMTKNGRFQSQEVSTEADIDQLSAKEPVLIAMATCHSLTIIDNRVVGDPMDLKMFEFAKWGLYEMEDGEISTLHSPSMVQRKVSLADSLVKPIEFGIVRQFTFSSKRQRMSVITCHQETDGQRFDIYAKGSPEMIKSLSDPRTIPSDYDVVLSHYTEKGFRVIALAWRPLIDHVTEDGVSSALAEVRNMSIEDVENNLQFIGLLIMENRLKSQTTGVIQLLKKANIRPVMITGDNILTALSVARECNLVGTGERIILVSVSPPDDVTQTSAINWTELESQAIKNNKSVGNLSTFKMNGSLETIIDVVGRERETDRYHFALDGAAWSLVRQYHSDLIPQLMVRGSVFARFSPDQKKQVVEELQKLDYYVGMCGDGANDCGALKTAHAGISLSEAEASVASPFTSKYPNISCVLSLIREGRAALVTSYGIFKFMAGYSMTQFLGVCIITWTGSTFTDFGFLYQDLVLLTTLCITFCLTGSYSVLVPKPPKISLLSLSAFMSLLCIIGLNIAAMLFAFFYVQQQSWFDSYVDSDSPNENETVTAVFLISAWHYITMSIIFSKGSPYRSTILTNYAFIVNILIAVICTSEMIMYPASFWVSLLELVMPPSLAFRAMILGISTMNFFACYLTETYFIDVVIEKYVEPKLKMLIFGEDAEYKKIEKRLEENKNWPPTSKNSLTNLVMQTERYATEINEDDSNMRNGIVSAAFIDDEETDLLSAKGHDRSNKYEYDEKMMHFSTNL